MDYFFSIAMLIAAINVQIGSRSITCLKAGPELRRCCIAGASSSVNGDDSFLEEPGTNLSPFHFWNKGWTSLVFVRHNENSQGVSKIVGFICYSVTVCGTLFVGVRGRIR